MEGRGTHPPDLALICRVPAGLCIQETMAKRVDGGGGEVRLWRFVSIAPSQATVKGLLLVLAYINFPFVRFPST